MLFTRSLCKCYGLIGVAADVVFFSFSLGVSFDGDDDDGVATIPTLYMKSQ